jgi:hypothetical protein
MSIFVCSLDVVSGMKRSDFQIPLYITHFIYNKLFYAYCANLKGIDFFGQKMAIGSNMDF